MARKLTFIPNLAGGTLIPMEDIPEDVQQETEEAYEAIRSKDGRIRVEFDTKEEADLYCRQVASYCAQRANGKLRFRRSPTRNLPETTVDFRITSDAEANGKDREKKGETK